jgi:hypothetical protein
MTDTLCHGMKGLPQEPNHATMMCQSCPRTPVSDVSGLKNKPGDDEKEAVVCYALRPAMCSSALFHCATLSAMIRVDFVASSLSRA